MTVLHFLAVVLWCFFGFIGWLRFYREVMAVFNLEDIGMQTLLVLMLVVTFLASLIIGPTALLLFRT